MVWRLIFILVDRTFDVHDRVVEEHVQPSEEVRFEAEVGAQLLDIVPAVDPLLQPPPSIVPDHVLDLKIKNKNIIWVLSGL